MNLSNNEKACPSCDGTRYYCLDWEGIKNGKEPKFLKYFNSIKFKRHLRIGWLYECEKCGQPWYLHKNQKRMSRFPGERIDSIIEWGSRALTPSEALVEELMSIKATPPDLYGNLKEYIRVPCKVTTKIGEEIDFSYVCFQKHPPLEDTYEHIRWIDEIDHISPSQYTLPPDVRLATSRADEVRMGYTPSSLRSEDGTNFVVNGINDFFMYDKYKGMDIRLADVENPSPRPYLSVYESRYSITYFIGDWDDSLLKLRIDVPEYVTLLSELTYNQIKEIAELMNMPFRRIIVIRDCYAIPNDKELKLIYKFIRLIKR